MSRALPQPCESEDVAIREMDEERILASVLVEVRLVETGAREHAALGAFPGSAPPVPGLQSFDGRIDERTAFRRDAPGSPGNESPAQHRAFTHAFPKPDDRHYVGRCNVVPDRVSPVAALEVESPLRGGLLRENVTSTHGLRPCTIQHSGIRSTAWTA